MTYKNTRRQKENNGKKKISEKNKKGLKERKMRRKEVDKQERK